MRRFTYLHYYNKYVKIYTKMSKMELIDLLAFADASNAMMTREEEEWCETCCSPICDNIWGLCEEAEQ